jgi:predicted dehydrogenase
MQPRIRLGVIGLGRRWQRYRPVLERLGDHLQVRAVCDQVGRRAERVARQHGWTAAGGPGDLLERDDVEAVLLLDRQWFGLWPLERACRLGKPVFCATPVIGEAPYADRLRTLVQETGGRVMMPLVPCVAPSFWRLSELLHQRLGPVQFLRAHAVLRKGAANRGGGQLIRSTLALSLFHVCRTLIGEAPQKTVTYLSASSALACTTFEFAGGRVAQVTLAAVAPAGSSYRLEVVGGQGVAVAAGPRWVRWSDAAGCHTHRLAMTSLRQYLLEGFLYALRTGGPPRPGFDDAHQCLAWQRAALAGVPDY